MWSESWRVGIKNKWVRPQKELTENTTMLYRHSSKRYYWGIADMGKDQTLILNGKHVTIFYIFFWSLYKCKWNTETGESSVKICWPVVHVLPCQGCLHGPKWCQGTTASSYRNASMETGCRASSILSFGAWELPSMEEMPVIFKTQRTG